jgi:hypothetical protein
LIEGIDKYEIVSQSLPLAIQTAQTVNSHQ